MNEIKLIKNGEIKTKDGREFTRLVGGFGDDKPIVTDKQIADLLGYSKGVRQVRVQINNNIKHFTDNDIIDLKGVHEKDTLTETLISLGYAKQSITQAENIYILSEAGFLLYLKFAEGDKAVELYKDFIEEYFKVKAENIVMEKTLQDTLKTIQEERKYILGSMFMESDLNKKMELFNRDQELERQEKEIEITLAKEETAKRFEDIITIAEQFTNSKGLYDFSSLAKILDIPGLGRNKLFEWMRGRKILMENNAPYQSHSEHFKVIPTVSKTGFTTNKTFIKPKGISYIIKKLIEDGKLEKSDYNTLMLKASKLSEVAV